MAARRRAVACGVDSRTALLTGGEHGPALVPGKANKSLLIQAIRRTHDEIAMPPDDALRAESVEHIALGSTGRAWPVPAKNVTDPFAAAGHWAFQPLSPVKPPDNIDPPLSTIDRFVRARLRDEQLTSVDRALPVCSCVVRTLIFRLATHTG